MAETALEIEDLKKPEFNKVQKTLYITEEQAEKMDWLIEKTNRDFSQLMRIIINNFFQYIDFDN